MIREGQESSCLAVDVVGTLLEFACCLLFGVVRRSNYLGRGFKVFGENGPQLNPSLGGYLHN